MQLIISLQAQPEQANKKYSQWIIGLCVQETDQILTLGATKDIRATFVCWYQLKASHKLVKQLLGL